MDEVLQKSGDWPNIAEPAGSDPAAVMAKYNRKPPSVFATDEPEPQRARFGEWVDSQDDDGAVDDPGVDSREQLEADTWSEWFDPETRTYTLPGDLLVPNSNQLEPDSWERLRLEEAMHNVIRDALQNLQTAIMQCVEQGMDVLSFDEGEFVDYQHDEYVGEYLSRAMRLLDRQAAITERECREYPCNSISCTIARGNQELIDKNRELAAELGAYRGKYEKYELVLPLDEITKYTADPPGWIKKCIAELTAERDRMQDVVRKQAESFKRLEIDLKRESDTCNTLRASVAGLKLTVDKLQGELDALRASGR